MGVAKLRQPLRLRGHPNFEGDFGITFPAVYLLVTASHHLRASMTSSQPFDITVGGKYAPTIRRIVTGHREDGKAVVASEDEIKRLDLTSEHATFAVSRDCANSVGLYCYILNSLPLRWSHR